MLVQSKFEVCVGVRSGPKGPVTDFSTFGLESLFKQNFKLALAYIPGRRACHWCFDLWNAPGPLRIMLERSMVWRPQCMSKQNLRFALGYVLGLKGPVIDLSFVGLESVSKQI